MPEVGGKESPTPLLALHYRERKQQQHVLQEEEGGGGGDYQLEVEETYGGEYDDDDGMDVDSEAEDARLHPTRRLLVLCACTLVGFVMNVMVSVVSGLAGGGDGWWGVLCDVFWDVGMNT